MATIQRQGTASESVWQATQELAAFCRPFGVRFGSSACLPQRRFAFVEAGLIPARRA